jgi:hypothetical protein
LMMIDLCRHSRLEKRGIASRTTRKALDTEGIAQDELLVVGADGCGHDRGDEREGRPRDGLSTEVRGPATSWPARSTGWCPRRGR